MEIKDIISSGLLELYITGLTSNEETLQVEQWAEQYAEVKKEIEELQQVMESYALAEAVQPDEDLKEKILSNIEPDVSAKEKIFSRIQDTSNNETAPVIEIPERREDAVVYAVPSYYKWLVAASIIFLIGSLIANYILYNRYKSYDKQLQYVNKQYDSVFNIHISDSNALIAAQQKLSLQKITPPKGNKETPTEKQNENTIDFSSYASVAGDKNSVPVVLKGIKNNDALAKIFWMKTTGEVFVDVTYLPKPPEGKQYQLWAIINGDPVDAGMITTPNGTYKIQKMKSFGSAEAFAITLEKAGGSLIPTMKDMIVKAKI